MNVENDQAKAVCIIVLREMLIAMDLSATVAEARPDLLVRWAATEKEALQHLPEGVPIAVAFVDVPPKDFERSALADRVRGDNALLILLGHDPIGHALTALRNRIRALPYPFNANDVLGVMAELP